jgi:hypothetical protein
LLVRRSQYAKDPPEKNFPFSRFFRQFIACAALIKMGLKQPFAAAGTNDRYAALPFTAAFFGFGCTFGFSAS